MKRIGKQFIVFFGVLLMAAGAFFVIAGIWDGFGNPTLLSRLGWIGGGVGCSAIGFYPIYLISGRDIEKIISAVIDSLLGGSFWP